MDSKLTVTVPEVKTWYEEVKRDFAAFVGNKVPIDDPKQYFQFVGLIQEPDHLTPEDKVKYLKCLIERYLHALLYLMNDDDSTEYYDSDADEDMSDSEHTLDTVIDIEPVVNPINQQ